MAARQGVLAGIIAFAVMAAPAEATIRSGEGQDRASDTINGGTSGHDILQVAAATNDTGVAAVAMRLAAAPAASGYPVGVLGTRATDGSCGTPAAVFLGSVGSGAASYAVTGGSAKTAKLTVEGTTLTLSASNDPQLGAPFDCALAGIATSVNATSFFDEIDAIVPLVAETPPAATPTPTPTPSPTPAAPAPLPVPAPTTANTPPVKVPASAKLTVSLSGAPSTIKRNKTMRLKLKIANDGSKQSSKVTISAGKVRGLSVGKVKTLGALKPAQKRTVTLMVKLTKRAKTSTSLKITVKSGKQKASSTLLLRIGKAKKLAPNPQPQEQAKKSPIVGTFWWRNVNHVDWAWDNRALYFVDGGTVFSGFPTGGLPAACTTAAASPEDEFDTRDGCLLYTYDEKTGAVTIGDKAGTFKDGKLTIDGEEYWPLALAQPGQRFTINEHKHTSFRGMCGLITGCSVTQEYLSLSPDGQFIKSRSTTTTVGDPGMGPWTAVGSYPPDQRGTYEVLAGGKIRLAFADGTVKEETFAIDTNHTTRQPDPLGEGVFIGEDNFYPDPFPDD
ncbi:hypothetical protein OJ997_22555 [Solirubrobacter phytolaccae]|uniref:CARDB domain-containing protein n=1 Tax=Solirubrobacter phytolaccae TaxID=1404360 RepID=A0A9X3S9Z6_9ACTN|nr:hypothetical protein [Solirubrobacter phytolaccae]MDA0183108.1 hypothetical protein [Solirubrobacter phytolaccae]